MQPNPGFGPRLFIATKVWTTGKAAGIAQMQASMRKLRAEPIDLFEVHNLVDVETHLATLRGWKRDGRVRYVGVTHYTASSHDAVARIVASQPLDFIQIDYSAGERDAERRFCLLAREARRSGDCQPAVRVGGTLAATCRQAVAGLGR